MKDAIRNTGRSFLVLVGALTLFWIAVKEIDRALFGFWRYGADSTDGSKRSGLGLRYDAQTGCHYLVSPYGGLTPRLSKNGKHICDTEAGR